MNWIQKIITYYKDNPEGYWFKQKIIGWGWVPVRWQGWLVTICGTALIVFGFYVGETDDAPGASLLGIVLAVVLIFGFGCWKGENSNGILN